MHKVAIFGGSFDPVHLAHMALAERAIVDLGLDEFRFLPCANPPHKTGYRVSDCQRLAMLELAITDSMADNTQLSGVQLSIDTRELDSARVSYSLLSLQDLRHELGPDAALFFIIGWDSLQSLSSWWHWQELFSLSNLLVATRPGYCGITQPEVKQVVAQRSLPIAQLLAKKHGHIGFLEHCDFDVSSTAIREKLNKRRSDSEYVSLDSELSASIIEYIDLHSLY